jgi:hypothetical protein
LTDSRPASPNPLGLDAPTEDRVPLAMAAVGTAAAVAVSWFSLVTFATVMLRDQTATEIAKVDPSAAYVNILLYGTPLGLALAGVTGWLLMRPIDSLFRRGGLAMVGALAGTVLAMMLTYTAHAALGSGALIGLAVLAAVVALRLGIRARRSA